MPPRSFLATALMLCAAGAFAQQLPDPILFGPEFRGFVGPGGAVTADRNQWDAGPADGETAFYNGLGLRLADAPVDILLAKKEGGSYHDQYGGTWTVRRLKVAFREADEVCDEPYSAQRFDAHCYFVTPRFGGYKTAGRSRIVGTLTTAEADAIARKTREEAEANLKKLHEEGVLDPVAQLRTPMFDRLRKAMYPHVWAAPVQQGALRPQDFPHFEISGRPGAWEVRFFNDHDGRGPLVMLGVVPGRALEEAQFGLSEKYHSVVDNGHSGILGVDTTGLDPFVVSRAFQDAYNARAAEAKSKKTLSVGEKLGRLLNR